MNETEEVIDPLQKLKIRPKPTPFSRTFFFLQTDNGNKGTNDVSKQCLFTDLRETKPKIDRNAIMNKIIKKTGHIDKKQKPIPIDPPLPSKKIILPADIIEEEEEKEEEEKEEEEKEEEEKEDKHDVMEKEDDVVGIKDAIELKQPEKKRKFVIRKKEAVIINEPIDKQIDEEENESEQPIMVKEDNKYFELFNPLMNPALKPLKVKTSTYYLNNRKKFIESIDAVFSEYKNDPDDELLFHQQIAREYLNLYTPYRGLLLFYGLGTGKSATAVAIAEGLKTGKKIFLMIPASLETNFISEIKKFGDPIYRKKQHWVFVSTDGQPENIDLLAKHLSLTKEEVKKKKGAWLMNVNGSPNFDTLTSLEKDEINEQLTRMIKAKYHQINYNANNLKRIITGLSDNGKKNPFDHSVIVIDEVHKLISMIVNKLGKGGKKINEFVTIQIYNYLMNATNARIVFLTGTPIVNSPNEIAILFNMLRGSIKTWNIPIPATVKLDQDKLLELFYQNKLLTYDYVNVVKGNIQVTRNPFGFVNQYTGRQKSNGGQKKSNITKKKIGGQNEFQDYRGVQLDESGNISDQDFEQQLVDILDKAGIQHSEPTVSLAKALPDDLDTFKTTFLNMDNIENPRFKEKQDAIFSKRILGLTSYYRVANTDSSLPELIDEKTDLFHIQSCPMSEYQFKQYSQIRKQEVSQQKNADKMKRMKKGDDLFNVSTTYRVYSRLICNFAFPDPPGRPYPKEKKDDEDEIGENEIDGDNVMDEEGVIAENAVGKNYGQRIKEAMDFIQQSATVLREEGLMEFSPKFLRILQNIMNPEHVGLHLVYSQFRTLEGIGVFQSVLEANGFVQFKVKKVDGQWKLQPMASGKPTFVLYTGTEEPEEREIVRNIYNGDWNDLSPELKADLIKINANNLYGEVIKIMMITSSAAEGINLRNTRYVHLMEPYWHMVRLQQVIGRARRFQSHLGLPKEYQNVKVFLYLATFSEEQIYTIKHTIGEGELKANDVSRRNPENLFTTDQTLFEMSDIKIKISDEILKYVKGASVDCQLYHKATDSYSCYDFGQVKSNEFAVKPDIGDDILERGEDKKEAGKGVKIAYKGENYYYATDDVNAPIYTLYSDKPMKKAVGTYDKPNKKIVVK